MTTIFEQAHQIRDVFDRFHLMDAPQAQRRIRLGIEGGDGELDGTETGNDLAAMVPVGGDLQDLDLDSGPRPEVP